MSSAKSEWTLMEAAEHLGVERHRLIYLCEKGVVRPDLQEADGRGSSRRFSARNLLEFAVALRLREFHIAAAVIGAVCYALRRFEKALRKEVPEWRLPQGLLEPNTPDIEATISEGLRLRICFPARPHENEQLGWIIDLGELVDAQGDGDEDKRSRVRLSRATREDLEGPVQIKINVNTIARELGLR